MSELDSYFYISKLISRKVDNTISDEELEFLTEWLAIKENQELFAKISDKNNFERWERNISKKNTDKAWQSFKRAVKQENKKSFSYTPIIKYAAIFLLPLCILASLINFYPKEKSINDMENLTQSNIEAEATKPELILNNGQKLILEDEKLTSIKEKDGTTIKNENGKLSYNDSKLKSPKEILYHTIVIPKGSEYEILLSDGSKVILNSLSSLKYPVQFSNNSREVELTGEGYFEVKKDAKRPFIVKVEGIKVEVLGTKFNIKSYDNDKNIVTTLVSGSVEVKTNPTAESIRLLPNEQVKFNKEDKNISIEEVDVMPIIAWKEGVLVFKQERLEDIMNSLQRWYDIEVTFLSPEIKDLKFGGSFKRDGDLLLISKMLTYTKKVNCTLNGNKILLTERDNMN